MRSAAATIAFGARPWMRRLRLLAAIAVVWAALHFVIGPWLVPTGLDRPIALAATPTPILAALMLGLVVCAGAGLGTLLAGSAYPHREAGLIATSVALAAWALDGGNMTDWLMLTAAHTATGPPAASAYWPLFLEYVYLLILMGAAAVVSHLIQPDSVPQTPTSPDSRWKDVFKGIADPRRRARGLLALAMTTIVIGLLMLVLTGPSTANTLRGQVYFAVAVSCAVAVFLTRRLLAVHDPLWFWPAPLLAGLLGMLIAALKPDLALPTPYNQLNLIPAWGLVRPLPIEMVGVGVTVTLWMLRRGPAEHPPEAN